MKIYVIEERTKTSHCYRVNASLLEETFNYGIGTSNEEGIDRRLVFNHYGFCQKSLLFYCFKRMQVILRNNVLSNFM